MRHSILSIIAAILCFFVTSNASAWDGQRKGFQLGIGLGPGQSRDNGFNKIGLGTDFKIGYAPSNRLSIHWMTKTTFVSLGGSTLAYSVGGAGVSYALKNEGASPYVEAGAGFSAVTAISGGASASVSGAGGAIGAGYNFANRFSVGGDFLLGSISGLKFYSFRGFISITGY